MDFLEVKNILHIQVKTIQVDHELDEVAVLFVHFVKISVYLQWLCKWHVFSCTLGLLNQYLTKQMDDEEDEDKSQEDDSEEEDVTNTMLQNCLASIVEALSYNNPL